MKKKELESIQLLEKQIKSFNFFIKINKGMRYIGLGSKKISEMEGQINKIKSQLDEFNITQKKFNSYLSEFGWIAYDNIDFEFIKEVIKIYESNGRDKAEEKLYDYYKPDNLNFELLRLKNVPQFQRRYKFISFAYEDYKSKRYYAAIPLLLMIIDGAVNDVLGKGFHSDSTYMDVWDSITTIDGGIEKIKTFFKKGRYKTNEDLLDVPYRNGILHGIDLNYDNYKVAAKCWHFLFVIRDWMLSKQTESTRFEKYLKEKNPPPIMESIRKLSEVKKEKQALKEWKEREIAEKYLENISVNGCDDKSLPEWALIKFLELWKRKNYGHMAKMYSSISSYDKKTDIINVKNQFKDVILNSYKILSIIDEAPAISEIELEINSDESTCLYRARLLFEGADGQGHARNFGEGKWNIIFIHKK